MDPFINNKVLVQFVRDYLFDLAKYLLAEDSGDDLTQMDYSHVCLDVVV